MSFEAMTWAVKQRLPSSQKLVLLMLADRTNRDTGRCTPSHRNLADDCGMSLSSLKRCLAALQQAGLVEIVNRSDGDVSLANQYRLNITGGWVQDGPTQSKTRGGGGHGEPTQPTVDGGWGQGGPGGGSTVTYKPGSNNQEVEPKDPPPARMRACATPKDQPSPREPPPDAQPPPWLADDLKRLDCDQASARSVLLTGGPAFAMHPGWRPGPLFTDRCAMAGAAGEFSESQLGEFISFWGAEGSIARQAQWEHRFLKRLRRDAAQGESHGSRRPNRGACPPDIVHDTSWLDADAIAYVESGIALRRRPGEPGV